jgi:hypothetical protein
MSWPVHTQAVGAGHAERVLPEPQPLALVLPPVDHSHKTRRGSSDWGLLGGMPHNAGEVSDVTRTYEIRLSGLVPTDYLLAQVMNVDVAEQELSTVLSGRFVDQAELHGFLNRLQSLGLEVVELRRVSVGFSQATPKPEVDP